MSIAPVEIRAKRLFRNRSFSDTAPIISTFRCTEGAAGCSSPSAEAAPQFSRTCLGLTLLWHLCFGPSARRSRSLQRKLASCEIPTNALPKTRLTHPKDRNLRAKAVSGTLCAGYSLRRIAILAKKDCSGSPRVLHVE